MDTFYLFRMMCVGLWIVAVGGARADDPVGLNTPMLPAYVQECGSCHLAYPPGLLPAESWRRLMASLPQHFGSDASLDAPTTQAIATWLVANAGAYMKVREAPPQDRITRAAWFVREHREIAPATWQRASIKSPAQCAACHTLADTGSFREREIRIPK
jgi:hypothetical protein